MAQPQEGPIDLVFEGGGAKGFAHIGAFEELSRQFEIRTLAGSSAGALAAVLFSAGVAPEVVLHTFSDPGLLFGGKKRQGKGARAQSGRGALFSTANVVATVDSVLRTAVSEVERPAADNEPEQERKVTQAVTANDRITFEDLAYHQKRIGIKRNLIITTTQLLPPFIGTTAYGFIWKPNGDLYFLQHRQDAKVGWTACNTTAVADVLGATIAIPYVFNPRILLDSQEIDGGVLANFPVSQVEEWLRRADVKPSLFGVVFKDEASTTADKLVRAVTSSSDSIRRYSLIQNKRIVEIDTNGIGTLDFNTPDGERLVEIGRKAVRDRDANPDADQSKTSRKQLSKGPSVVPWWVIVLVAIRAIPLWGLMLLAALAIAIGLAIWSVWPTQKPRAVVIGSGTIAHTLKKELGARWLADNDAVTGPLQTILVEAGSVVGEQALAYDNVDSNIEGVPLIALIADPENTNQPVAGSGMFWLDLPSRPYEVQFDCGRTHTLPSFTMNQEGEELISIVDLTAQIMRSDVVRYLPSTESGTRRGLSSLFMRNGFNTFVWPNIDGQNVRNFSLYRVDAPTGAAVAIGRSDDQRAKRVFVCADSSCASKAQQHFVVAGRFPDNCIRRTCPIPAAELLAAIAELIIHDPALAAKISTMQVRYPANATSLTRLLP